jgi:hypothetical protein
VSILLWQGDIFRDIDRFCLSASYNSGTSCVNLKTVCDFPDQETSSLSGYDNNPRSALALILLSILDKMAEDWRGKGTRRC